MHNFINVVRNSLLEGADHERVIDKIPIPELHIHEGLTNKHARELNEEWGDDQFYKWCKRKNIKMEAYHNNQLNVLPTSLTNKQILRHDSMEQFSFLFF